MLIIILSALFGAWIGGSVASFVCVAVERIPKGESINGRSLCACGRKLEIGENIPIIGWLRARGVADCCGAKIPSWYLRAEIVGASFGAAGGAIGAGGEILLGIGVGLMGVLLSILIAKRGIGI